MDRIVEVLLDKESMVRLPSCSACSVAVLLRSALGAALSCSGLGALLWSGTPLLLASHLAPPPALCSLAMSSARCSASTPPSLPRTWRPWRARSSPTLSSSWRERHPASSARPSVPAQLGPSQADLQRGAGGAFAPRPIQRGRPGPAQRRLRRTPLPISFSLSPCPPGARAAALDRSTDDVGPCLRCHRLPFFSSVSFMLALAAAAACGTTSAHTPPSSRHPHAHSRFRPPCGSCTAGEAS